MGAQRNVWSQAATALTSMGDNRRIAGLCSCTHLHVTNTRQPKQQLGALACTLFDRHSHATSGDLPALPAAAGRVPPHRPAAAAHAFF